MKQSTESLDRLLNGIRWHCHQRHRAEPDQLRAFIEIEEGIDGLLHVSDELGAGRSPSEVVAKGDNVQCVI